MSVRISRPLTVDEYAKRKNVCLIRLLINDPTDVEAQPYAPSQATTTYHYNIIIIIKSHNVFESFIN